MPGAIVTRDVLRRELIMNAARKPLAVGVGVALLVAAVALSSVWLLPVALLLYLGLAASTLFDAKEAERVGRMTYERARAGTTRARTELPTGFAPELAELLRRARMEEQRILHAISESDLPFEEISVEVEGLSAEMERIAGRAQAVSAFLAGNDRNDLRARLDELSSGGSGEDATERARERAASAIRDQLRIGDTLRSELERFRAEMEHLIASLGVVHGQLVRISVSFDPQLQDDVAREVRNLRSRVGAMADGLREATMRVGDDG